MKVTVYTTKTCTYCHALMDWMNHQGIEYEEKNSENPMYEEEVSKVLGYKIDTVPTTVIGDDAIVGFDRRAILKALAKYDDKK